MLGVNKKDPYQMFDAKQAGQGHVNLKTGILTFLTEDLSLNSAKMPVNIVHVYKNGWKLNYKQSMVNLVYTDEVGDKITFVNKLDGTGKAIANLYVDNQSLLYEYNSDTKILKRDELYYRFNANENLYEISDGLENVLKIDFDLINKNQIKSITDSNGNKFIFSYTNTYLNKITCYDILGELTCPRN